MSHAMALAATQHGSGIQTEFEEGGPSKTDGIFKTVGKNPAESTRIRLRCECPELPVLCTAQHDVGSQRASAEAARLVDAPVFAQCCQANVEADDARGFPPRHSIHAILCYHVTAII